VTHGPNDPASAAAPHTGGEYLLGDDDIEIARLRAQHAVWGPVTARFLDRLGVGPGWRCLDVGAGPGLVTAELRARVGDEGEVTAIEPSRAFRDRFLEQSARHGWRNVQLLEGTAESVALPPSRFDLVFVRWVLGFLPDPDAFLRPLAAALRPGGVIAIQEYMYEGIALFPRGGAWERVPDTVRAWWRAGGGDPFTAASLPPRLRRLGLRVVDLTPNSLAGGPGSGPMTWVGAFLEAQVPVMVARGLISEADAEAAMADWRAHQADPDALVFTPIVVDVAARRAT
jgi:SAM-dependent methyltransferase